MASSLIKFGLMIIRAKTQTSAYGRFSIFTLAVTQLDLHPPAQKFGIVLPG